MYARCFIGTQSHVGDDLLHNLSASFFVFIIESVFKESTW